MTDLHRKNAADLFNVPLGEVTDQQRRKAKAWAFGVAYDVGQIKQGLSVGQYPINVDFNSLELRVLASQKGL
jgi:DNA polymerase I-like protein with 3'-5' exonuclease and polymerase domains